MAENREEYAGQSQLTLKHALNMKEETIPMTKVTCAFCFSREQGKNGEIRREWSPEWLQFIQVCRKHAKADGMDNGGAQTISEL